MEVSAVHSIQRIQILLVVSEKVREKVEPDDAYMMVSSTESD
jgi:hypothetical protein